MLRLNKEFKTKLGIFRNDRRAYYSFLLLAFLFIISLPAELICNIRPILLVVEGKPYFPIAITYSEKDFGGVLPSEPDYKSKNFTNLLSGIESSFFDTEEKGLGLDLGDFEDEEDESIPEIKNLSQPINNSPREYWMLWPPVRYDYKYIPTESVTGNVVLAAPYKTEAHDGENFHPSSWKDGHYLGTDDRGRDVLARLVYGFQNIHAVWSFTRHNRHSDWLPDWRDPGVFWRMGRSFRTKINRNMGIDSAPIYSYYSQLLFSALSSTPIFNFKSDCMDGNRCIHTCRILKNKKL